MHMANALVRMRRRWLIRPLLSRLRGVLPAMSATEREALEAGDTWWDAALFSGNPDWNALLSTPPARLSSEEQAFVDGPVESLCRMADDWRISFELRRMPDEVWEFIKANRFFGMIIPKEHGGLGFSAAAHSAVIRKLSTRSVSLAVTVMVPNSLGPGELLLQYGTEKQKRHYLPRLADGREIPCFALTSPEAGSDAASMLDRGIVCYGEHRGERTLGMRVRWSKRYITLGPVATLLGLAFKLCDPEHLLGDQEELGITVALVPTGTPGVTLGRRHFPAFQAFENGPTTGTDVFMPLSWILGGEAQIGQGWKMLMGALAAGRGISLPSLSAAGAAFAARTTGAYGRIREQFHVPVGRFEGVQECLANIAGTAYLLDAARCLTAAGVDQGRKPAVISAIVKAQATYRMRTAINDAMDVHGGKAICDGPLNYLGNLYRAIPVGMTVEGANILTRSMIIFGQGAIRCHPHLLQEMTALQEPDERHALEALDAALFAHLRHMLATLGRAIGRSWTRGRFAPAPDAGAVRRYYRQLGHHAAAFALVSEVTLLSLGGALKRKEMLSARLGDVLSELYLLSAVLKRFEDDGRPAEDLPLVRYCCEAGFATIGERLDGVIRNFPSRPLAGFMRVALGPGGRRTGPDDRLIKACAGLLLEPSAARDRLTEGVFLGTDDDGVARLERAFELVVACEPLRKKLKEAGIEDIAAALEEDVIDDAEAVRLREREAAVRRVVMVDDFAPEELSPGAPHQGERPSRSRQRRAVPSMS
jgi:acyl-CoA dehydrogenase